MSRPSFQFYHGDWRRNAKLRRCNHAQRGIWLEIMCLMADQDEYGVLRWPLADIANAVPCRIAELRPLIEREVLKGAEDHLSKPLVYSPRHAGRDGDPVILIPEQAGPIWYSSRMVRDSYIASIRGKSTRFGEQPKETPKNTPNDTPKGGFGDEPTHRMGDGPSSSSSTSIKTKSIVGQKPDVVSDEARLVLAYLNQEASRDYRPVPANMALIAARLKEGATVDDCKAVIDRKCREWRGGDMEKFLRPATLFNATKFAQYQGEKECGVKVDM